MDDIVYDIEEIISHRKRPDGKYEYFVKWKGYDKSANTWEPETNFESPKLLEDYHKSIRATSISKELGRIRDDVPNQKPKKFLEADDLLTPANIKERNLVPHKVLNIFHVRDNEKDLVAYIRFKGLKEPQFVHASWAHKNCPQLVIKFYESRIFWRDRMSGELTKGLKTTGKIYSKKN